MAQVMWIDNGHEQPYVDIIFDDPERIVIDRALKTDPDVFQRAITELIAGLARQQNETAIRDKISELQRGQFGILGAMSLA